jgi:hypothetical protein
MRTQKDKKTLDAIGKELVVSGSVSEAEIDGIVAQPQLFHQISRRIAVSTSGPATRRTLGMRLAYVSAAVAVAVVAVASTASLLRTGDVSQISAVKLPASGPDAAVTRPDSPPQDDSVNRKVNSAGRVDQRFRPERAAATRAVARSNNRPVANEDSDFYAVSDTGGETLAGGRIVRVDMPRSQAFALGMHVPLENESDTVKADLLVGPDGVTRAMRLVK